MGHSVEKRVERVHIILYCIVYSAYARAWCTTVPTAHITYPHTYPHYTENEIWKKKKRKRKDTRSSFRFVRNRFRVEFIHISHRIHIYISGMLLLLPLSRALPALAFSRFSVCFLRCRFFLLFFFLFTRFYCVYSA